MLHRDPEGRSQCGNGRYVGVAAASFLNAPHGRLADAGALREGVLAKPARFAEAAHVAGEDPRAVRVHGATPACYPTPNAVASLHTAFAVRGAVR